MKKSNEKYDEVLELLKRSRPILDSTDTIEERVIRRISVRNKAGFEFSFLAELIFGWVYIGWVRRSLITAAVVLVLVFVYQQGAILTEISCLRSQVVSTAIQTGNFSADNISKKLLLYRHPVIRSRYENLAVSESQIMELIKSMDQLKNEYHDLLKLIDEDPELKNLIEKRMTEINNGKVKL